MASPEQTRSPKKDWVGLWFEYLAQEGEYTELLVAHLKHPDDPEPTWTTFEHAEHDGISVLMSLLKSSGQWGATRQADIPQRRAPSFWVRLREYLRYLWRMPFRPRGWRKLGDWQPDQPPQPPTASAWHVFGREDTKAFLGYARRTGVTVNSLLLAALDESVKAQLCEGTGPTVWMLPVHIREGTFDELDSGNNTSFIDIYLRDDRHSAQQVHQQAEGLLHRHAHWGGWLGMRTFRWIGAWGLKLFLKLNPWLQPRTGAFTNLGRWGVEDADAEDQSLWVAFPPVLRYQPLGAAAMTWNGRLAIGLWIHPILRTDPQEAREVVGGWVEALRDASAPGEPEPQHSSAP